MEKVLIVGGTSGIGLSIALQLRKAKQVYILGRKKPSLSLPDYVEYRYIDLFDFEADSLSEFEEVNTLIISAGFGELQLFEDNTEEDIIRYFNINTIAALRIVKFFYHKLRDEKDFYCAIMGSISGFISSPFYALYGASKAAIKIFIESVNVELEKAGTSNRILHVAPGVIEGTAFHGGINNPSATQSLAEEIIIKMRNKEDLFIPKYDEIYRNVLMNYQKDFRAFGLSSYDYKLSSGRVKG